MFVRVTDLVSFNSLEASAKKGGMADPSGLMVVLLLLLSEGLVARWGGGGLDSSGPSQGTDEYVQPHIFKPAVVKH